MSNQGITIDENGVKLALARLGSALGNRRALLATIAAGQLVSVRRTFREQGSPADSWAPLAESTRRKASSKATAGRKILIVSGRLLNSIQSQPTDTGVVIGTNLVYARVQQEGSADRRGAAIGPQARIAGRSSTVGKHSRKFLREIHYGTREVIKNGKSFHVPVAMLSGKHLVEDKRGRVSERSAKFQGPRHQQDVKVAEHERFGNIPPRPYLIFRPEDPERIREQVQAFTTRCVAQAGLAGAA